jgi:hypothetical protein
MKEIVLKEKKETVSIDEIDNSSIIGIESGIMKKRGYIIYCGKNKNGVEKFAAISFSNGFLRPNVAGCLGFYGFRKSILSEVKLAMDLGSTLFLFDTKRELFKWGLEGLED